MLPWLNWRKYREMAARSKFDVSEPWIAGCPVEGGCELSLGGRAENAGGSRECGGAFGGEGFSRAGLARRPGGDGGLRVLAFLASAGHFPECPGKMEVVESGHS